MNRAEVIYTLIKKKKDYMILLNDKKEEVYIEYEKVFKELINTADFVIDNHATASDGLLIETRELFILANMLSNPNIDEKAKGEIADSMLKKLNVLKVKLSQKYKKTDIKKIKNPQKSLEQSLENLKKDLEDLDLEYAFYLRDESQYPLKEFFQKLYVEFSKLKRNIIECIGLNMINGNYNKKTKEISEIINDTTNIVARFKNIFKGKADFVIEESEISALLENIKLNMNGLDANIQKVI